MATPTLPRNLRVYPGATNNIEKPGIQRTLCIRTKKTQKTKTMVSGLSLSKDFSIEFWKTSRAFQKVTVNITVV
jgi:hypothetical protein